MVIEGASRALAELLWGLFRDAAAIRSFLDVTVDSDVLLDLPATSVSVRQYAIAAVDELVRRDGVDTGLFAALVDAVPGRSAEIRDVAVACGVEPPASPLRPVARLHGPPTLTIPAPAARLSLPAREAVKASPGGAATVLVSGRLSRPAHGNPASLLNARYTVVPFHAGLRARELTWLQAWCETDASIAITVVAGPGGVGKTRLMFELIERAKAAGFVAGFVPRVGREELEAVLADEGNVLAVVDYAETRPAIGRWLERAAERVGTAGRLRIVLVVRALGDWWRALQKNSGTALNALLGQDEPVTLRPEDLDAATRARVFAEAATFFEQARGGSRSPTPIDLSERRFGKVLYLHMAALAAIEGRATAAQSLLEDTRLHERQFWLRDLRGVDEDDDRARRDGAEVVDRAVAALALAGGATGHSEAHGLLARAGVPEPPRGEVLRRLVDLYPGTGERGAAGAYVSPLEPDLLASAHVAAVLLDPATPAGWVAEVFAGAPALAVETALLLLGRLAGGSVEEATSPPHREAAIAAIRALLVADLPGRAAAGLAVAGSLAERELECLLAAVLTECLRREGTPELAASLAECPCPSAIGLYEIHEWIHATVARTAGPEDHRRRFASLLQLGAVKLAQEDRRAARELIAEANAEAHLWLAEDATALGPSVLGIGLLGLTAGELGEHEEAVARAKDSVRLCELLEAEAPGEHEELVLRVRMMYALALFRGGMRAAALTELAVIGPRYALLADNEGRSFAAEQALCDFYIGVCLHDGGRHAMAAEALQRAVEAQRGLASSLPGCHLEDLAWSLVFLCDASARLELRTGAATIGREAVRKWEALAAVNRRLATPGLALALGALASAMVVEGLAGAEQVCDQAIELLRPLCAELPRVYTPELASTLASRGMILAAAGDVEAARAAFAEAQALLRPLLANRPLLARVLLQQAIRLVPEDAEATLAALNECLQVHRSLDGEAAEGVMFERAAAALTLGALCSDREEDEEALAAYSEGLTALERAPVGAGPRHELLRGAGLCGRAWLQFSLGDEAGGRAGFEACLRPLRAAQAELPEAREILAYALGAAGRAALQRGDVDRCKDRLREAITLRRSEIETGSGEAGEYADDVTLLALLLVKERLRHGARALLQAAEALLRPWPAARSGLAECLVTLADLEPDVDQRVARAREVVRLTAALPEEAWREEAISVVDRLVAAGEILAEQRHIDEGLAAGKLAAARGALALIADDNEDLRDSCIKAYVMCAELHEFKHDDAARYHALEAAAKLCRPLAATRPKEYGRGFVEVLHELSAAALKLGRTGAVCQVAEELRPWTNRMKPTARSARGRDRRMSLYPLSWGSGLPVRRPAPGRASSGAVERPVFTRNQACPCGSGKKYKRCCLLRRSE